MIKKIKNIKEVEEIDDIICDVCGRSCKGEINFEYLELYAHWGFDSNKDGEEWLAHICEKCVDEKFSFIDFKKINHI